MKDKRIKICSAEKCFNKSKRIYESTDSFCSECSDPLVLACKKCNSEITDKGPEHNKCLACKAKSHDLIDKAMEKGVIFAISAAIAAKKFAPTVINMVKK